MEQSKNEKLDFANCYRIISDGDCYRIISDGDKQHIAFSTRVSGNVFVVLAHSMFGYLSECTKNCCSGLRIRTNDRIKSTEENLRSNQ